MKILPQLSQRGIILQNFGSKRYQYEVGENLQGFEIKHDRLVQSSLRATNVAPEADDTPQDQDFEEESATNVAPSGLIREGDLS